ncbi:hypothetical protein CORC01_02966 [Colletotrichum orchidophilum]|uniref:Uncharacterized protein n=1 Tax=Colletotrichum orchidophilum TaxID=1209926 RepID=A0A1G4BKC1_9PEZI|nr:uncharacterized protein CORC01_02966 [Colletotrichum orchidophilum]OHF01775.1 hypothetical protein CORC01_02966 [Colletotrichum orchidophilum]
MQHPIKERDKGGWLSKFKKGASNKPSVLQKAPPPQQIIQRVQQSLQAAPPPQGFMPGVSGDRMTPGVSADQRSDWQAMTVTSGAANAAPEIQYRPLVPSSKPIPLDNQAIATNTGGVQQASISQNPLAQGNTSIPTGPLPRPAFTAQQQYGTGELAQQHSASVPPGCLVSHTGSPMDQAGDNLSDAASVSTMDVSEAQAQPVMRPQLVTVERHAAVQSIREQRVPQSAGHIAHLPQPPSEGRPLDGKDAFRDSELVVPPLFSKSQTKTTVSALSVNEGPVVQNKWAKKSAVDYSGDDWGDDPWEQQ